MLDSESPYSLFTCQRPSPRTFRRRAIYIATQTRGVNGFFSAPAPGPAPRDSPLRRYSTLPSTFSSSPHARFQTAEGASTSTPHERQPFFHHTANFFSNPSPPHGCSHTRKQNQDKKNGSPTQPKTPGQHLHKARPHAPAKPDRPPCLRTIVKDPSYFRPAGHPAPQRRSSLLETPRANVNDFLHPK